MKQRRFEVTERHTQINRYALRGDVLSITLDVSALSSGGLTITGQCDELDRRIMNLPNVVRSKQHGWVYEDDDSAQLDIQLLVPTSIRRWLWRFSWVQMLTARIVRDEVEAILNDLLP